ncbi:MAG: thioredoxin family protein [Marinifilaceae bacterium]|jgi:thiol:disulfide interchange protein DsbD|nr:thioredoxin family protein [Marinifilaceae bacterium]
MKKLILAIVCLFTLTLTSLAQFEQPAVWKFSVKKTSELERELVFSGTIDANWHVYSMFTPDGGPMKASFELEKSDLYSIVGKPVETLKPHKEHDKIFGVDVLFYEGKMIIKQKIKVHSKKDFQISGTLSYQACQDGKCVVFEPEFTLDVKGSDKAEIKSAAPKNEDNKIVNEEDSNEDSSIWAFFWLAFVGGLLAVIMPCVFPMIPMTVSFFMHSDNNKAKARAKALFFSFSIIAIYTALGLFISMVLGADFINWLSTNWVPNLLFFIIFMIFAASFFGAFEIVLPSWIVSKSDKQADKGGYIGAFFMAFTLVLVSFSCTAPIVGNILVEAARGAILRPIIGMFGFSLAVALPFGFFAFFPSRLQNLPKSGGWLNSVKVVLGFIEVALGFKFLMVIDQTYHLGILDREIYIAIWIVVFTLMGFYLLGKIKFAHDSEVKHIGVFRLLCVIATFTFVVYLIPGMIGAPLKALAGYMPPQETIDFDVNKIVRDNAKEIIKKGVSVNGSADVSETPKYGEFLHLPHGLEGYFDYDQAVRVAKKANKPLFIDFTGHGCVNCREMEQTVWANPRVKKILEEEYIICALYVDDKSSIPESDWITREDGKVLKKLGSKNAYFQIKNFESNAQPNYILLDYRVDSNNLKSGVLAPSRGHNLNIDEFVAFLKKGVENYKKRSK